jgi:hypothetical protein
MWHWKRMKKISWIDLVRNWGGEKYPTHNENVEG